MIGHFLLTLTPAQEERVLTHEMRPGAFVSSPNARCLRGVAEDYCIDSHGLTFPRDPSLGRTNWPNMDEERFSKHHPYGNLGVADRYDTLCDRFGVLVVNTCIRNRVLSNQARRLLTKPVEVYA